LPRGGGAANDRHPQVIALRQVEHRAAGFFVGPCPRACMCGFSQRDADGIESIDELTRILAACRLVTLVFFEINAPRTFFDQPQHSDSCSPTENCTRGR